MQFTGATKKKSVVLEALSSKSEVWVKLIDCRLAVVHYLN